MNPMTDLEQRIRDLPLPNPSAALDRRMAELFSGSRRRRLVLPTWKVLSGTALAAGLVGFAAGLSLGQWSRPPRPAHAETAADASRAAISEEVPVTYVRLTDARIGSGLDFSRSLEPFHVQPITQEGS